MLITGYLYVVLDPLSHQLLRRHFHGSTAGSDDTTTVKHKHIGRVGLCSPVAYQYFVPMYWKKMRYRAPLRILGPRLSLSLGHFVRVNESDMLQTQT